MRGERFLFNSNGGADVTSVASSFVTVRSCSSSKHTNAINELQDLDER